MTWDLMKRATNLYFNTEIYKPEANIGDKDVDWASPELTKVKPEDRKDALETAAGLHKELAAVFYTDSDKVNELIRGKSPDEMHVLRLVYKDKYGKELDNEIHRYLGGKDLAVADASLAVEGGNDKTTLKLRAHSYVANLLNCKGLIGFDKGKIKGILEQIHAIKDKKEREETLREVKAQFKTAIANYDDVSEEIRNADDPLAAFVHDKTADNKYVDQVKKYAIEAAAPAAAPILNLEENKDRDAADALVEDDTDKAEAKSAALKLKGNVHGGLAGKGGVLGATGHDKKAVVEVLEKCSDESDRAAVLLEYYNLTGKDLVAELEGGERDVVVGLLTGDKTAVRAGKMRMSTEHIFTEKDSLLEAVEGRKTGEDGDPLTPEQKKEDLQEEKDAEKLFEKNTGKSFNELVENTFDDSKLEQQKLTEIRENGKASDELLLREAMNGHLTTGLTGAPELLVNKEQIKAVLKGKTPAEVDALIESYNTKYPGSDLRAEIAERTGMTSVLGGGREGHDIDELLHGSKDDDSESMEKRAERVREHEARDYDFERGAGSGDKNLTDNLSNQGFERESEHQRFLAYYKLATADGAITGEELERIKELGKYGDQDSKDLRESKDAIADNLAAAAKVVATAAATAIAGPLGPAAVALISALAAGVAELSVKAMVTGHDIGSEEVEAAALKTLLNAAVGVGMAGLEGPLDELLKIAPDAAPLLHQKLLKTIASKGLEGFLTGTGEASIDKKNRVGKGGGQAFMEALGEGGETAGDEILTGVTNTVIGAGVEKIPGMSKLEEKSGLGHAVLGDVVTDTGTYVATTTLKGEEISGTELFKEGASSAVNAAGTYAGEKREEAAKAKEEAEEAERAKAKEEAESAKQATEGTDG